MSFSKMEADFKEDQAMLQGTYYVAKTVCNENEIFEDVWYRTEEKAMEAAKKLSEAYGGKATVDTVEM